MDFASNQAPQKRSSLWISLLACVLGLVVLWNLLFKAPETGFVQKATVVLRGDSPVTGSVTFEQNSKTGPVRITGQLKGFEKLTKHGFHVHSLGDLTQGCASTGSHYNPYEKTHGAPVDATRHVGDLGNIQSDVHGVANIDITDSVVTLNGPLSILGRSVVVHAGTDDLGKGGDGESLKTGNAGARAACGVIGLI